MIVKSMLGLERVMTQRAVIQRDHATKDSYGAKGSRDWQPLATVPCFMWWGTGTVITRMGSVHERPEENVDLEVGGMILPEGTDVTPRDRVTEILDADGNVIVSEPLEVLSVGPFEGVTELLVRRIS